jgi:hypothetical protein
MRWWQQLDVYVFPEIAQKIQDDISNRLGTEGYGDIKGGQQLADTLTAQLQQLSQDRNLRLHFSPAFPCPTLIPMPNPLPKNLTISNASQPSPQPRCQPSRAPAWAMSVISSCLALNHQSLLAIPLPPP